jgi:hypothetical protein
MEEKMLKNNKKGESVEELESARLLYPRVSDIIGKQTDREMRSIPIDTLVNACVRGTKVHAYCTTYLRGLYLPDIEPEYQPYVDAFIEWADDNIHQTLFSSVRLYDDSRCFSGEYDCIVVLKDSKQIALIDIKTSANASKSWPIQLAAYKHLCDINGYDVETVFNLHLKKTKCAQVDSEKKLITPAVVKAKQIPYQNLMPYWEIFTNALNCYDYFDRKEKANVCV